ncbi:hypothetical protein ANO11243_039900 [Dothideomycetidae sp. 11243]|nr:hypothetical protein ANO11243_039900 [fungal sp. No.11243]
MDFILDHEHMENAVLTPAGTMKARFLREPGNNGQRLVMLVKDDQSYLDSNPLRGLESGERLRIHIHQLNPDNNADLYWSGEVIDDIPFAREAVAVRIWPPFNREKARFHQFDLTPLGNVPEYMRLPGDRHSATGAIREATSSDVDLRVVIDQTHLIRSLSSMQELQKTFKLEKNACNGQSITETLLLGNDTRHLPEVKLYPDTVDPADINMVLSEFFDDQKEAAEQLLKLRGGIGLVEGAAGTGKTRTVLQLMRPLFTNRSATRDAKHKILILTPANELTDELRRLCSEILKPINEDIRIVHWFSRTTNRETIERLARLHVDGERPALVARGNSPSAAPDAARIGGMIHERVIARDRMIPSHMYDRRMTEPELEYSLGSHLLKRAEQSPDYDAFMALYQKLIETGFRLKHTEKAQLNAEIEELTRDVISETDIFCATVAQAGEPGLFRYLQPTIIIVDEAGRVPPGDLRHIFSRYRGCERRILIGDPFQPKPQSRTPLEENCFALQGRLSDSGRLSLGGHPRSELRTQRRYVTEIASLVSNFFYEGKLLTIPSIDADPRASKFQTAAKVCFGVEHRSVMFFDAHKAWESCSGTHSRYNIGSAAGCWWVAETLMVLGGYTGKEVAIYTPYTAQDKVHHSIRDSLFADEKAPRGRTPKDFYDIHLSTFEKCQGQQCDVVILDLTATKSVGFLDDAARVLTGMTRGRFGLIIVGNRSALNTWMRSWHDPIIRKIADELSQRNAIRRLDTDSCVERYKPHMTDSDGRWALGV